MSTPDVVNLFRDLSVSRETIEMLEGYVLDLEKWSKTINLVGAATLNGSWQRHILDSAQLLRLAPGSARHWCDLGSGGGLPGLVVSILHKEQSPQTRTSLMESDARKAAFLKTTIQKYSLNAQVIRGRIETASAQNADVISARALAPLTPLLAMVSRHLRPGGIGILHKGRKFEEEVEEARASWQFSLEVFDSLVDRDSRILRISMLEPKGAQQ